jgi:hypothetical protein
MVRDLLRYLIPGCERYQYLVAKKSGILSSKDSNSELASALVRIR